MERKYRLILASLLVTNLFAVTIVNPVSAAPWGAKKLYTTPKATRGTWQYKDGRKTKKLKITAHTSNGRKLYRVLPTKQYDKWWTKMFRLPDSRRRRTVRYLEKHMWQAYSFTWHGKTGFNTNGWLAGAGAGEYCVPVTKKYHGVKTTVLRFGSGAGNWFDFYAYPVKKHKKAVPMAQKYTPKLTTKTIQLKWGSWFSDSSAQKYVSNVAALPKNADYYYTNTIDTQKTGYQTTSIQVFYPDGTHEIAGKIKFQIGKSLSEQYPFEVKDLVVKFKKSVDIRKDIITNPIGYFPNESKNNNGGMEFSFCDKNGNTDVDIADPTQSNINSTYIKAEYPDGSVRISSLIKVIRLEPDSLKYQPILKEGPYKLKEQPYYSKYDGLGAYALVDPEIFFENASTFPKGTICKLRQTNTGYQKLSTVFPDGSMSFSYYVLAY
ncbi:hypothetical protein FYJ61_07095 [Lactobacillus equicursoris]|uniref:Rib domain-containing protein n=1 Tax=Lactobacillus equicursoris TaxID=420645 RepID=A0A844FPB1_9LACO|nr:Rib/alpha-like domain-containing protein [Lactobacillus equicursoris]MDD6407427.1 Rib/alpha-like domain-containing protein [Lactobacillus equicursoris]MST80218.1 hypothetical protein [Lactobacillus equicursoris]